MMSSVDEGRIRPRHALETVGTAAETGVGPGGGA